VLKHCSATKNARPYATLSYCWGAGLPLKTTSANILSHCQGIPLESFPKTLAEAIRVTRRLKIRYIWIDALCIIQDGDGQDWAEQSASMTDILNISALESPNCDAGLLPLAVPNDGLRVATALPPVVANNIHIFEASEHMPGVVSNRRPLSTPGWAYQERLVSPASLHYTRFGMVWECCSEDNAEYLDSDHVKSSPTKDEWQRILQNLDVNKPADDEAESDQIVEELNAGIEEEDLDYKHRRFTYNDKLGTYYACVEEIARRDLTKQQDRLPAMAGIAARFARALSTTYVVAALWPTISPSSWPPG